MCLCTGVASSLCVVWVADWRLLSTSCSSSYYSRDWPLFFLTTCWYSVFVWALSLTSTLPFWLFHSVKKTPWFYFILLHNSAARLAAFHMPIRRYIAHYIGFNLCYRWWEEGRGGKWETCCWDFQLSSLWTAHWLSSVSGGGSLSFSALLSFHFILSFISCCNRRAGAPRRPRAILLSWLVSISGSEAGLCWTSDLLETCTGCRTRFSCYRDVKIHKYQQAAADRCCFRGVLSPLHLLQRAQYLVDWISSWVQTV